MQHKHTAGGDMTFVRFIILAIVIWFVQCSPVLAQQNAAYVFHHINQTDGLLNTVVRAITQDSKGYIWILTPNGLQRYDGSRFVNYPYELNNPNGIMGTRIADLFVDKRANCLWITNPGIEKFDLGTNKFTSFPTEKLLQAGRFKFDKYADPSGKSWLLGSFGIFHYNAAKRPVPFFMTVPSLAPGKSGVFFTDTTKGEIWVSDWERGLLLFQKRTKNIYTHTNNPLHHPFLQGMSAKNLRGILKDTESNIWIGSGDQFFYKYNTLSKKLSRYSLSTYKKSNGPLFNQSVLCFFEDNHHVIWIGTENTGLWRYDREKDSFKSMLNEEKNDHGLKYNYNINCIFQDKDENIWLGTDKGISIFNPYRQYFQPIHHEESNPLSLPRNEIEHFIQTADKDIIVGTWGGGLTVYDSNWSFKKTFYFKGPFEYNLIWSLIQQDNGTIWAGSQHGYIHIYDPLTHKIINTIHPPELNNSTIRCMVKDRKGNIWLGLHDGKVAKWDKEQNKFYAYNDHMRGITQLYAPVLHMFFDNKQRCWVSTEKGFKQLDMEKRIYSAVYLPDKKNPYSISADISKGVEQYNDSTLIIGTVYGGLNFFNPDTKIFTQLTTKNGLPSNTVHAIKKDKSGYFWFTTDYNLYKFKSPDKKFILLNLGRTINTEFKTASFYPLQDGRWLTSTTSEIICFRPEPIRHQNTEPSKVEITGFRVFDDPIFIDSILVANQPVKLNYKQNFLTVDFSLLNFSVLQQTKYYYQLRGVDKDWINAGTKNFASYTNLQPGKYVFSVKADNEISSNTSFKIIISPPFWERWWFIAALAFLFLAIIYRAYRYRIDQVFKLIQIRQRIATDLHDDIGSTLSNINILSELSKKSLENPVQAHTFLNRISEEVQTSSQSLDDIIWSVNTQNDNWQETFSRMRRYAAEIFENSNTHYTVKLEEPTGLTKLNMEKRRDIFLIYKEILNNIHKHAAATETEIDMWFWDQQLMISIRDNGKGFDQAVQTHRNGLKNLKSRVARWKGTISIDTGNAGTYIQIMI